jgi:hypothetical protein
VRWSTMPRFKSASNKNSICISVNTSVGKELNFGQLDQSYLHSLPNRRIKC